MYEISFRLLKISIAISFSLCFSILEKGYSQNLRIDSLTNSLKASSGLNKIDVLIELARANYFVDTQEALKYINDAYSLSVDSGNRFRIVKASRIKAQILRKLEKLEEAIEVYEKVYTEERNKVGQDIEVDRELTTILNGLGITYALIANYDKALEFHFQALILKEREGDLSEISISLNNIGFVYFKLKDYEKALEYFLRSLDAKNKIADSFDLDRLYINIGICNIHLNNFSDASKYIKKGFEVCGAKCSDEIIIEGEFGLGVANFNLKDFDAAKPHFMNSYKKAKSIEFKRWEAENLVYLARINLIGNHYEEAKTYLTEGESISSSLKYNQLVLDHYKEFANLYRAIQDYENAALYQNKYITLKDSLIGEELVKNIARTQTQFEERENIKTIALKDEALSRQRMLNLAIGTIAFLAALLVFVLYQSNKVKRRVNAKLSDANAIIAEQNKQLQAHSNILQAEVNKATADLLVANQSLDKVNKELDNFIYKTSHDIRGPLASLKGMCNVALIDVKDDLALDYLRKLDATATKLNRILTRLLIINQINNATLNPEPLDMDGIVDDIIRLETKKGLPAGFIFKREIQRNMAIRSDDALIRIILENLIDNSIKFYNDSDRIQPFVLIKIFTDKTYLNIHVIDNGVGISSVHPDKIFQMFTRASEKSGTGGLGLYLIKQSANRLGGDVGLRLTEHGDTEFYVTLPLEIPSELLEKKEDNKLAPSVKV